jgi:hypothetical protein
MFLVGGDLDQRLREAFGPGPCIVADGSAKGAEGIGELLEFAHRHAGLERVLIFPRFRGQTDYAANAATCALNSNSTGLK